MSDLICPCVFMHTVHYFLSLVLFFSCNSLVVFPYLKYVMNCPLCDDVIPHEISVCVYSNIVPYSISLSLRWATEMT